MTDDIREQLSALLDDELDTIEVEQLLDQIEQQGDLQGNWDSYYLIGDIMRGEGVRLSPRGVADQVHEQLKSEPAIIAVPGDRRGGKKSIRVQRWAKPAVGAALAASVAVMAVYLLPQIPGFNDVGGTRVVSTSAQAPYLERTSTRWKNLSEPKVESQLNRYLVDHSEFASAGGVSGVLPYASFVIYDSNSRP